MERIKISPECQDLLILWDAIIDSVLSLKIGYNNRHMPTQGDTISGGKRSSMALRPCAFLLVPMLVVLGLLFGHQVAAATKTVCASGCDYTNLHDLFLSGTLIAGDTVNVGATYSTTGESFDLAVPVTDLTLDCQSSGAVIGVTSSTFVLLYANNGSVIRNCTFNNLKILADTENDVHITNNTFNGISYIDVGGDRPQVNDNRLLDLLYFHDMSDGQVSGNTFETPYPDIQSIVIDNSHNVDITSNEITNTTVSSSSFIDMIKLTTSTGIIVATNTFQLPYADFIDAGDMIGVLNSSAEISYNKMTFGSRTGASNYLNGISVSAHAGEAQAITHHNTMKILPTCTRCIGISYASWTTYKIYATSTYNLIYYISPSSTASIGGLSTYDEGADANFIYTSDYNAAINTNQPDKGRAVLGTHSYTQADPCFKTNDADTTNDFDLVPFSYYLDVNGTQDIGEYSGSRIQDITVNSSGPVDFTNIHATGTSCVAQSLRNGDRVTIAAGNYGPMYLNGSPLLTGNVSISGAGATTNIIATSTGSGIHFSGVASSTVSDLKISDASTTLNVSYSMTRAQFKYGATTYDQGAGVGLANATFIITSAPSGGSCTSVQVDSDGDAIPTSIGTNGSAWNLALVDYSGHKLTFYGPDNFTHTAADIEACAGPGLITVEKFVPDIFTSSGVVLSYNQSAATAASVSVKAGDTDPPSVTRYAYYTPDAGVVFNNASTNTVSNITSANNGFGVIFQGSSYDNVFSGSTISGSSVGDVYSTSTRDNSLGDATFDRATSLVVGSGSVNVKYSFRAWLKSTTDAPIGSAGVTFTSFNTTNSQTLTTAETGYTPYSSPTLAYRLTSSDISETSGGYNPYSAAAQGMSGYNNVSQDFTLNTPQQTVTLSASATRTGGKSGGDLPPVTTSYQTYVSDGQGGGHYLLQPGSLTDGGTSLGLIKLPDDGNPKTQEDTAVYFMGTDLKRHAFPNEKTYFSWYCDFSQVRIVDAMTMASIPLGANISYRPGYKLVKFVSVPTVYYVGAYGMLLPIADETAAIRLYGAAWNKNIDDISDAFYGNYVTSDMIYDGSEMSFGASTTNPGLLDKTNNNSCAAGKVWPFRYSTSAWNFTSDLNSQSHDVVSIRALQEVLAYMGTGIYPEAMNTGVYGQFTALAVGRYQTSVGLPATGNVGPATREKLNSYLDTFR